MSIISKLAKKRQQIFQQRVQNSDSYNFFNILTCPALLLSVESLLPDHRERLYPPTETLSIFMAQALSEDRSCQKAVNDFVINRVVDGLPITSTATGAYCKARQRLPLNMVSELVKCTSELIDTQLPKQWLWHGRRVRLIDGTSVIMPDTKENQEKYPQQTCQKEGLGFPICRIVGIICFSSGAVVNASIGQFQGKGSGEQSLLRQMQNTFEADDIVLGDALFGTYFFLAYLIHQRIDGLFEQMGARKRTTDFRKGKRLGEKDHLIVLTKPKRKPEWMTQEDYDNSPETLTIRELKVGGKVLITTLLSRKDASKSKLKALYKRRWEIEVDFKFIKTTMGMEMLSCKTAEMAEKEIWVYFLAYNLIRLLMAQSALLSEVLPQQISFKHTLQLWLSWDQQGAIEAGTNVEILFILIAQKRVGNRSGRIEPRAIKRRGKMYPNLMQPRAIAIEEVKKNGHGKKLK